MERHYRLFCPVCKKTWEDTYLLTCPDGCNSLIRTQYRKQQLEIRDAPGLFCYSDWLPVESYLPTRAAPICFRSSSLAHRLGLENLWIGFSGFWPERNAFVTSGSFKEFEAFPTIVRLRECGGGIILVSSAGNTGRAFAQVSAETGQPVIIVIPENARDRIYTSVPTNNLLLVTIYGDYTDAINLGNILCNIPGIYPEGGAKNVARRDGMGTVMIAGTRAIGSLPDWYVQAVGSGTGGIAAWEASLRLRSDGRYGEHLPRLCLIQNDPFIPMVHAWNEKRRDIIPDLDLKDPENSLKQVYADVLTNRAPPYSVKGGVFDSLIETNGIMRTATSEEAKEAYNLMIDLEGIDPDPAAAVSLAGLIKALDEGIIKREEVVLLNVTGGGYQNIPHRFIKKPDIIIKKNEPVEEIIRRVSEWVKHYA